jgi:CMP-N,N'-diacetyllegionaminic acid synthase
LNVLSIIPARGGSKRIKRKNIKPLAGHPLIYYTIQCSLNAKEVHRTIVSTEDKEIRKIVTELGAEAPFLRPEKLAQDSTHDYPVVRHCVDYLINQEQWIPHIIVFLRPTMPLRVIEEVNQAVRLLIENPDFDCVRTSRPVPYPPYWMKRRNEDGFLEPFDPVVEPYINVRSQDLPQVVTCDGYVDATRLETLNNFNQVVAGNAYPIHRENIPFVDLDTPEDWEYCKFLMEK